MKRRLELLISLFCLLGLAGCSIPATPLPAAPVITVPPTDKPSAATAASQAVTAPPGGFADPFAYCQAVGTIDQPDERYQGPKTPEAVVKALMKASGAPADAPVQAFSPGTFWRCMDHQVYACFVGANLPCESKPPATEEPSALMSDYCKANPNLDFIPAAVSGHETLFAWACQEGKAVISQQVFHLDPQGYIREIWYALAP